MEYFDPKIRNKKRISALPLDSLFYLGPLLIQESKTKKQKVYRIEGKRQNSLFSRMTQQSMQRTQKNSQEAIRTNEFSNVAAYKINIQKSLAFLIIICNININQELNLKIYTIDYGTKYLEIEILQNMGQFCALRMRKYQ